MRHDNNKTKLFQKLAESMTDRAFSGNWSRPLSQMVISA